MSRLRGRVAVVTGGAGGIGAALGRAFAAEGARVALLDIDEARLERVARSQGALAVVCDITDPESCVTAMDRVVTELGGVDILVNNAGISHVSPFDHTDPAVLRRVMEVNFFGAVHCTRAALPWVVAARGWLVTLSSVAGFAPLVGRTGYAASKHALHGFFDSLRAERAGSGVSVLIACPAFTDTGIRGAALDGRGVPVGDGGWAPKRQLSPDAVARRIVRGVKRRERQVVLGGLAHASWWVSRFSPRLYDAVMRRTQPTRA